MLEPNVISSKALQTDNKKHWDTNVSVAQRSIFDQLWPKFYEYRPKYKLYNICNVCVSIFLSQFANFFAVIIFWYSCNIFDDTDSGKKSDY